MRARHMLTVGWVGIMLAGGALLAAGAEPAWDRFHGPNGSGVSEATTIPTTWTEKDYLWQVDLPGRGVSSPVIWEQRLFVTAANLETLQRSLLCYDTQNGKLLWQRDVPFTKEKKHARNSYATNTPAVDAERVYTLWQAREGSQLLAYSHQGDLLWSCDLGPYESNHGGGLSPALFNGQIALNNVQEGKSEFLGIDAAKGDILWRVPRKSIKASYSTPCIFHEAISGRPLWVFTDWWNGFTAVDPRSGEIVWEKEVFDRDGEAKRAIASPFIAGEVVYGNSGFTGGKKYFVALKPGASSEPETLFRLDRTVNHMPTALAYQGKLFLWTDGGIVLCADAATGKTVWQGRVGGNYSGSPICVGGKLYCLSEEGEMVVLGTGNEFTELARIPLPEGSSSTPAVSGGVMFFRTDSKLFAIGGRS